MAATRVSVKQVNKIQITNSPFLMWNLVPFCCYLHSLKHNQHVTDLKLIYTTAFFGPNGRQRKASLYGTEHTQ
jgi:hypothetical protein